MGAVAGLVGVSGCRDRLRVQAAARGVSRHGGSNGVDAVCFGQTALDGKLQQLIITQVTVERIIFEGQNGAC